MVAVASCSGGSGVAAVSATPFSAPAGVPGCTTGTASAPELAGVSTAFESVADLGSPFGVVVPPSGDWSFVSADSSVGVFRIGPTALPSFAQHVSTPQALEGEAMTPDGRYLLAAGGTGAVVISVSRAEAGEPAVLGTLSSGGPLSGAVEVTVSPGGRFAFVSLENSGSIAVFDLQKALTKGFSPADLVGRIPVDDVPVGMAVSPDGRWLYLTTESMGREQNPGSAVAGTPGSGGVSGEGTLTVISLARAETDPATSVVATVEAGCSPVRVITSADGSVVWVTARESDRLLGFSAARLRSDPAHSLIASIEVGEAPVGLVLVDQGARLVVADSNRLSAPGATSDLAVVDVAAALAGRPAVLGYLPAGGFPREMALELGGSTLLVTDYNSEQLEAVSVAHLP
jgi:DNA-binding beta-propeller fold protein YncE